ncbi:BRO family protein, partial [uncultured Clostridium sp.]|uniref:BRO-N domain-containing protein n=1 Tax=uncultured Clostridium sp. TaxID=59620 RepID=UPI00262E0CEB
MNDLIIGDFEDRKIYSFVWRNKPCWVAIDIARIIGYKDESTTITSLIKREGFKKGQEYEVLSSEILKEFKEVFAEYIDHLKYSPKIVIFYEEGLYGFLAASRMKKGVEFRTWIRRDVMPSIRKKGYYVGEKVKPEFVDIKQTVDVEIVNDNLEIEIKDDKLNRLNSAYKSASMFKELLDDITMDSTYKFLLLKQIYIDAG